MLEKEPDVFTRASWINQARVHNGYHYPRSLSTALKSARYFKRFLKDFDFAIDRKLKKIYAVASQHSHTNAQQFKRFCEAADIACDPIPASPYFRERAVSACFETEEYAFDAQLIKEWFLNEVDRLTNLTLKTGDFVQQVSRDSDTFQLLLNSSQLLNTGFLLNTSYASVNQVKRLFGFEPLPLKYEIAELCLCDVPDWMREVGLTVMDGPFFSLMPFNSEGVFSLSAVHYTPHQTSSSTYPLFDCQSTNTLCSPDQLDNCNLCAAKPKSAWPYMRQLSKKFLLDTIEPTYRESLFAIKPLLKASEVDDSRPTLIRQESMNPTFISVLSGKINTIYDLDYCIP